MKKNLFIFITLIIFLFPLISFASAIPKFPMAFYGNVTINGVKAPEGTVIKAYYGPILAGQSTVDSSGAYGYVSSIAKKLLVSEGDGIITFKFQLASILSGVESTGTTTISFPGFGEGVTINKDLAFTYTIVSSGGGGGGGGSNSSSSTTIPIIKPIISITPTASSILGCENRTSGFSFINGQSCLKNVVSDINQVTDLPVTPLSNLEASTYNLGTKILKNGSRGEAVKELQRFLNDTLKLGLVLDGKLGPKTIAVIKQWQKNKGLVPDGLIGPKTKALMR